MAWEMVMYEGGCPDCGRLVRMEQPVWLPAPREMPRCEGCGERRRVELGTAGKSEEGAEARRGRLLGEAGMPDLGVFDAVKSPGFGAVRKWVWGRRFGKCLFVGHRQSGLGKTWGVWDVARELVLGGEDVCWIDCCSWFREVCGLMAVDGEEAERRIRRAKGAGLLVLDDLGKQHESARSAEILWDVVNARARSRNRRFWVTTNRSGEELAVMVGARFETVRRRLQDVCEVWPGLDVTG